MLLTSPKKRVATIIVGSMKPSKSGDFVQKIGDEPYAGAEEKVSDGTKVDSDPALLTAAEAVLSAVKRGDAKGLSGALHAFVGICMDMPHEEGEQSEQGEEEEGEDY
jgi:hypothetical protein